MAAGRPTHPRRCTASAATKPAKTRLATRVRRQAAALGSDGPTVNRPKTEGAPTKASKSCRFSPLPSNRDTANTHVAVDALFGRKRDK
jgi:hypothetical protein